MEACYAQQGRAAALKDESGRGQRANDEVRMEEQKRRRARFLVQASLLAAIWLPFVNLAESVK